MSEPIGKFWMVYGIGQREPVYRHGSKDAPRREAQRLAESRPGICFVVMAAVDAFMASHAPVEQVTVVKSTPSISVADDDGIPF